MVKIELEFKTVADASEFLRCSLSNLQVTVNAEVQSPAVVVPAAKLTNVAAPVAGREQQAKPAKASAEPAAAAPAPVAAAEKKPNEPVQAVKTAGGITVDTIRADLRKVFNEKGAKIATDILKKFGAAGVSAVKEEDYAAFLAECQK